MPPLPAGAALLRTPPGGLSPAVMAAFTQAVRQATKALNDLSRRPGRGGAGGGGGGGGSAVFDDGGLARAMRDAARNTLEFVAGLAGASTTLKGFISQSVHSVPGVASTLNKSMDLVKIQISRAFIPFIALAAAGLQSFAKWLGEAVTEVKDFVGAIPKMVKSVDDWIVNNLGPPSDEWKDFGKKFADNFPGGSGVLDAERGGLVGQGVGQFGGLFGGGSGIPRGFVRSTIREQLGLFGLENAGEKLTEQARYQDYDDASRGQAGGLGRFMAGVEADFSGSQVMKAWDSRLKEIAKADHRIDEKGNVVPVKPGQPGGGGTGGLLHDVKPPGYNAQFSGVSDFRRKLQLDALNTTPLDLEIAKQSLKAQQEMLKALEKIANGKSPFDPD